MILSGKVALVTGGSRGIGRAICVKLSSLGAHVFVNYSSRPDAADETVILCKQAGGDAESLGFNVGAAEEVDAAFNKIKGSKGTLDILVNNAGISRDGLLIRMKDEDWDKTIATNLSGAFYCARAAARIMMKARTGTIINISSVVGEMGNAGQIPYVSSKAGLVGMTKALAKELGIRGIRVNAIAPGFIETDMTKALDEKLTEEYMKVIPLGRFGRPEEVAALAAFLAGPEAAYITGQVLGINGGMHM